MITTRSLPVSEADHNTPEPDQDNLPVSIPETWSGQENRHIGRGGGDVNVLSGSDSIESDIPFGVSETSPSLEGMEQSLPESCHSVSNTPSSDLGSVNVGDESHPELRDETQSETSNRINPIGSSITVNQHPSLHQPNPQYNPQPDPLRNPQHTPQPTTQPVLQHSSQPTPQPVPQHTPQPTPQPVPQHSSQPTPQPVPQHTPQPTPQPVPQHTPQPTPQPVLQHSSQPTLQPDPQHSPHIGSGILSVSDIQEQRTRTASSALQWGECDLYGVRVLDE